MPVRPQPEVQATTTISEQQEIAERLMVGSAWYSSPATEEETISTVGGGKGPGFPLRASFAQQFASDRQLQWKTRESPMASSRQSRIAGQSTVEAVMRARPTKATLPASGSGARCSTMGHGSRSDLAGIHSGRSRRAMYPQNFRSTPGDIMKRSFDQVVQAEPDIYFGRLNFHPESRLSELVPFLQMPRPSRLAILSGPEGIGRRYLLQAALHRLRSRGQSWELIDLDLDGYEPDRGDLRSFVDHLLLKRGTPKKEAKELSGVVQPLLDTLGEAVSSAFILAIALGLARTAQQLGAMLATVPKVPMAPLSGIDALAAFFDRLIQRLGPETKLAVFVRHPYQLPEQLKRLLFQLTDRSPSVVLAFAALPEDSAAVLARGTMSRPVRFELRPIKSEEMPAVLSRNLTSHRLPAQFADALRDPSKGLPSDMAYRLFELTDPVNPDDPIGLYPDDSGVWRLPDEGLEAAPLLRIFSYGYYDPIDELIRKIEPQQSQEAIVQFLAGAALCGDDVPVKEILSALKIAPGEHDAVVDFIDAHLVVDDEAESEGAGPRFPVFTDLQFTHPGLPRSATYVFTTPLYRHAFRDRLPARGWGKLARRLSEAFAESLPPTTRAAAGIHLSLLRFLDEAAVPQKFQHALAWWVGQEDCQALTELVAGQLVSGRIEPGRPLARDRGFRHRDGGGPGLGSA